MLKSRFEISFEVDKFHGVDLECLKVGLGLGSEILECFSGILEVMVLFYSLSTTLKNSPIECVCIFV